jgi:hypothetical protein
VGSGPQALKRIAAAVMTAIAMVVLVLFIFSPIWVSFSRVLEGTGNPLQLYTERGALLENVFYL